MLWCYLEGSAEFEEQVLGLRMLKPQGPLGADHYC